MDGFKQIIMEIDFLLSLAILRSLFLLRIHPILDIADRCSSQSTVRMPIVVVFPALFQTIKVVVVRKGLLAIRTRVDHDEQRIVCSRVYRYLVTCPVYGPNGVSEIGVKDRAVCFGENRLDSLQWMILASF